MITFGYNSRFSAPLRALLFVAFGVLMLVARADAMQIVVKIISAFILAAGLVSVYFGFKQKEAGVKPLSFFNAAVTILVAVLLFAFSGFVAGFVSYLIGVILLVFGLFQIFVLLSAKRQVKLHIVVYLIPVLSSVLGALILFCPKFLGQGLAIIAGVALIVSGASDLVSAFKVRGAMNPEDKALDAKEVDYEKVDEQ